MPNAFAYFALFSWPLVALVLFRGLPSPTAIVATLLVGYLLLPSATGIDLPLVPTIDKDVIVGISAAIILLAAGVARVPARRLAELPPRRATQGPLQRSVGLGALERTTYSDRRSSGTALISGLLTLLFIVPFLVMVANGDPVLAGPRIIPGMQAYDALSSLGYTLFYITPFLLGWRYLATEESHAVLLKVLGVALMCYSLPILWEVRMSPQLHTQVYGFFPHDFIQQIRGDGFRPVVFFRHGLVLAIFVTMACLATVVLWRCNRAKGHDPRLWLLGGLWLLVTLFFCKSFGAILITLFLLPVVLFMSARGQIVMAAVIAGVVLFYPMLRGSGLIPVDTVLGWVQTVNEERAGSFAFRIRNEDALLARANEKPLTGWGTWGRNRVYDPVNGGDTSTTDGAWIIVIGTTGWLGYIAFFGLLTIPTMILCLQRRALNVSLATSGLALVMAANLIDLLPNSSVTPLTWLICGALAGRCYLVRSTNPSADSRTLLGVSSRSGQWGDRAKPARASVSAGLAAFPSRGLRTASRQTLNEENLSYPPKIGK